ncbi:hypothetical protein EDB89DRAFT_2241796 [Lactarius sanguifluus]|nr:hypothetical protein EDB89DRAFT_2241796 [Lactarius sanguifluus]
MFEFIDHHSASASVEASEGYVKPPVKVVRTHVTFQEEGFAFTCSPVNINFAKESAIYQNANAPDWGALPPTVTQSSFTAEFEYGSFYNMNYGSREMRTVSYTDRSGLSSIVPWDAPPEDADSPGTAHPSTRTTLRDMASNAQNKYYHLARGHDGGTRQMYAHSAQGTRVQPSQLGPGVVESTLAGSGIARTPSVYSSSSHHIQGVVTSPPSQIGYQHPNRPLVAPSASNGGRGASLQSSSPPSSSGPYAPNTSATHIPPVTPASPMKHQWSEGGYRASEGAVSLPYVTAALQPSPTTRTNGGRIPSQSHGSNPTRYTLPQCKMPHCDKPAIFDQNINEQLWRHREPLATTDNTPDSKWCRPQRTPPPMWRHPLLQNRRPPSSARTVGKEGKGPAAETAPLQATLSLGYRPTELILMMAWDRPVKSAVAS